MLAAGGFEWPLLAYDDLAPEDRLGPVPGVVAEIRRPAAAVGRGGGRVGGP
ncbi:MAG: hypothetical protein WDM92_14955 [Caulobacteraceae bacterium]